MNKRTRRFFFKVITFFQIFSLALQPLSLLSLLIVDPVVARAESEVQAEVEVEQKDLNLSFDQERNNLELRVEMDKYADSDLDLNLDYSLTYVDDQSDEEIEQAVMGQLSEIDEDIYGADIYLGTCSGDECSDDVFNKGSLEIGENYQSDFILEDDEIWFKKNDGHQYITGSDVELGKKYVAPQNSDVTVTFSELPEKTSPLSIEEITLTEEEIQATGAISDKAYDITTEMENGSFKFDLTLPSADEETEVVYVENREEILTDVKEVEQEVVKENNAVKIKDLNHLTLFIPVNGVELSVSGSFDGEAQVTVEPSETIEVDITVQRSDGSMSHPERNDWGSTSWKIDGGSWTCVDHTDHDSGNNTSTESFNITAPSTEGTYDISFRAHRYNDCGSSGKSNEFTLDNGIVVEEYEPLVPVTVCNDPLDDYSLTSSVGVWSDVSGGSNISGEGTNEVRWGYSSGYGQSGLRFDSVSAQTFDEGTPFLLGTLTHMNWPITSAADGATLEITLSFSNPVITPNPTFEYDFNIEETPNSFGSCPVWQQTSTPCDDKITFPSSYGDTVITIGDVQYTLVIDGFVDAYTCGSIGGVLDYFITEERKDNTAYLVGHLSSVLVEEPAISITKKTNNTDVSSAPGPELTAGDVVTWQYIVQNTGNVDLENISVVDNQGVIVDCGEQTTLASGASMTCTASGTVIEGQYSNTATVTGNPVGGSDISDSDTSWYTGVLDEVKVDLCHATSSDEVNPFNLINVSINSVSQCEDVNGHGDHEDDIIPPYTYGSCSYLGKNWDDLGQAIWNNGCEVPTGYIHVGKLIDTDADGNFSDDQGNTFANNLGYTWSIDGSGAYQMGTTEEISIGDGYEIAESYVDGFHTVGYYYGDGSCNSLDGTTLPASIDVTVGQTSSVTFCNAVDTGEIIGKKYHDLNINGVRDAIEGTSNTEPGLSGWTITLLDSNENQIAQTTTDGRGDYWFSNLPIGDYVVCETQQTGWEMTEPIFGGGCRDVTVVANQQVWANFGNVQLGNLEITKIVDWAGKTPNGDEEFEICIAPLDTEDWDCQTTDYDGGILTWNNLIPGGYRVDENRGDDWILEISPSEATVVSGQTAAVTVTNTQKEYCGDGIINGEEECDYGELNGSSICSSECALVRECLPNMAANGGFEIPTVSDPLKWDIFTNSQVPGWTAEWHGASGGGNEPQIELHAGVNGWSSSDNQYVELDSDWDGPGGGLNGEAASISIYQNIPVIKDYEYRISWSYSPRPNHNDNRLEVKVGADSVFDSGVVVGSGSVNWTDESYTFVPDSDGVVKISFTEIGNPDSYGMFLDDVSVECLGPAPITIRAQKVVCDSEEYLPNWGNHGAVIGETTAQDYVNANSEHCRLEDQWQFQWARSGAGSTGDFQTNTDLLGGPWNTFTVSDTVEISDLNSLGGRIELREVFGYGPMVGFSNDPGSVGSSVSSEFYCTGDVYNYDNWEWINNPQPNTNYYCVAFNAYQRSDVTVCKLDAENNYLSDWKVVLRGINPLENVTIVPDGGVYSSSDLTKGDYALIARGTYEYRGGTGLLTDTAYSERLESDGYTGPYFPWINVMSLGTTGALGVMIDGNPTNWGDYLSYDHRYALGFTDYQGTFDFSVYDNYYSDNVGNMSVDVYEGYVGVTEEDGCFTFEDVPFGTYQIDEVMKDGWRNVSGLDSVDIDSSVEEFQIVNEPDTYDIHGYKWSDINGDGLEDSEEPKLSGWKIFVDEDGDGQWDDTELYDITDDGDHLGWYVLENLVPGEYRICEELKDGWVQTYPLNDVNNCHIVNLPDNNPNGFVDQVNAVAGPSYNFGNQEKGNITIYKFNDLNINGKHDEGEPYLSDWEINISKVEGENYSQMTGTEGSTAFSLISDSYVLGETMQDDWSQSGIYCEDIAEGALITGPEEAYGHHGACEGWNGCGNAETCALWACEVNGYSNLVSYGDAKPCTEFESLSGMCHLFWNRGSVQWNWSQSYGGGCPVMGVTDIYCSNSSGVVRQIADLSLANGVYHDNVYNLNVKPGDQRVCYIGNYQHSELYIEKSNNVWPTDQNIGDEVTYTIKLTAIDGPVYDVSLFDLPPNAFGYVAGSYTAHSSIHGELSIDEPIYASPGKWQLGNLAKDEIVTLTYKAVIGDEADAGIYPDMAWATGTSAQAQNREEEADLLALAGEEGHYGEDYFVGTQVAVLTDDTPATRYKVEDLKEKEGEVLGASTGLPATGARLWLSLLALMSIITGAGLLFLPNRARRRQAKGLLAILMFGFSLFLAKPVQALTSVRIGQPYNTSAELDQDAITSQEDFRIDFVILNTDNLSLDAQCQQQQDGGVWTDIDTFYTIKAGGNSGYCQAEDLANDSQYTFRIVASDGSETKISDTVKVGLDTDRPETPVSYERNKVNTCEYEIKFKTADDGRTVRVEIYRGESNEAFTAKASSRIATINIGPDESHVFQTTKPDCEKAYYYAIRAFDQYDNASDLVGDREIKTVIIEGTTGESEEVTLGALPATEIVVLDEGAISGEAASTETETRMFTEGLTGEELGEDEGGKILGIETESLVSFLTRVVLPILVVGTVLFLVYRMFIAKRHEK